MTNNIITKAEAVEFVAWAKKIDEGITMLQQNSVAANKALAKVLEELICLRNDVDELKRKD